MILEEPKESELKLLLLAKPEPLKGRRAAALHFNPVLSDSRVQDLIALSSCLYLEEEFHQGQNEAKEQVNSVEAVV